ncbi:unnamed protein product, partial [Linum tenue]
FNQASKPWYHRVEDDPRSTPVSTKSNLDVGQRRTEPPKFET